MLSWGIGVTTLPAINALFNATSVLFLLLAFAFIRNRRVQWHKFSILIALGSSTLFLTSYLIYHFHVGHVPYGGFGWTRVVYFGVLLTHTLLAIGVLPLIGRTIFLALNKDRRHPRLGRITLVIWLYVSMTGVIIFFMLRPYASSHFEQLQSPISPEVTHVR